MAFERGGKKLWTKAKTTVNTTLYPDAPSPGFCHLELDGKTIWAACACDAVGGKAAKVLVKLHLQGNRDASWRAAAEPVSLWGMSVVRADGAPYPSGLGAERLLGRVLQSRWWQSHLGARHLRLGGDDGGTAGDRRALLGSR